jgi:hypothetical protein
LYRYLIIVVTFRMTTKKMNNMTAFRRIGRTYPGPPPEVLGLEITKLSGKKVVIQYGSK